MGQPDPLDVDGLAQRSATGDTAALAAFIRATQQDVWRFVAHLAHPRHADDLTQETYLRAMQSIRRFEGRSTAMTWLLSIARRVVIDRHWRLTSRRPQSEPLDHHPEPTGRPGLEGVVELSILLDELTSEKREALVLTQVLGLSYAEAAAVCGVAVGTIRYRVARGREELASLLEG